MGSFTLQTNITSLRFPTLMAKLIVYLFSLSVLHVLFPSDSGGQVASGLVRFFSFHLFLPSGLRPVLQRPQQNPEQSVLLEQVLRRVRQLLQPPDGLQELPALLPVVLLQDLPLLRQYGVLGLQVATVELQTLVVAPQPRQLLRQTLAGAAQRLDLALQRLKLGTEGGGGTFCLARGCRLVYALHGAGVAQDEAHQIWQGDALIVGKLHSKVFPGIEETARI